MRRHDHSLDRAFDGMLTRASACKAVRRPVEMVIGAEQAGTTTRGRFP
jgi:hypothetical protein